MGAGILICSFVARLRPMGPSARVRGKCKTGKADCFPALDVIVNVIKSSGFIELIDLIASDLRLKAPYFQRSTQIEARLRDSKSHALGRKSMN
jgi:hypothetical protein